LHIPKTGGLAFQSLLKKGVKQREILEIGVSKGKLPYSEYLGWVGTNPKRIKAYKAVTGHLTFSQSKNLDDAVFITILRDPVMRFVSQYMDIKRKGANTLNHILRNPLISLEEIDALKNSGLDEFLHSRAATFFANLQTRYLISDDTKDEMGLSHLEQAKLNLENHIKCFGILEKFDLSLELFQHYLGIDVTGYEVQNMSKSREELRPDQEEYILALNRYDKVLYDFAVNLFDQRVKSLNKTE